VTRTFVAVFPPSEVAEALAGALEDVVRPGEGVSWVKRTNVHYTMRFLGDLTDPRVEAVKRAAAAAVVGIAPFDVRLGGVGAFPNERRARVLWLGAKQGAEGLTLLAKSLEIALGRERFPHAEHAFAPHLTLGRVREEKAGAQALARLQALELPPLDFRVDTLAVVKSTLDPKGSRYETLARCELTS
jgi:2'-5' RNA ligase